MNKIFALGLVVALLLGGVGGYLLHGDSAPLGATINNSNSLNQARLNGVLLGLHSDLVNTRAPLGGMVSYTSSSFSVPAMVYGAAGTFGVSTSSISSSTAGASALAGLVPGDFIMANIATTSASGNAGLAVVGARVSASDTVMLTFGVGSSTGFTTGLVSLTLRALPAASFAAPAAIVTATSSN